MEAVVRIYQFLKLLEQYNWQTGDVWCHERIQDVHWSRSEKAVMAKKKFITINVIPVRHVMFNQTLQPTVATKIQWRSQELYFLWIEDTLKDSPSSHDRKWDLSLHCSLPLGSCTFHSVLWEQSSDGDKTRLSRQSRREVFIEGSWQPHVWRHMCR